MATETEVTETETAAPLTETKEEEKVKTAPVEENEEEKAEAAEAVKLYRALNNPQSAERIIRILATEAGLLNGNETKREARDAIVEALEESLGEDHKWLAGKFAPAIKKILADQETSISKRFEDIRAAELQRESDGVIEAMTKEYDDFKELVPRITKLMEEINPTDKLSQKDYVKQLYRIARSEKSDRELSNNKSQKADKARKDAAGRIAAASIGGKDENFKDHPVLGRRAAIEAAMKELEAEG